MLSADAREYIRNSNLGWGAMDIVHNFPYVYDVTPEALARIETRRLGHQPLPKLAARRKRKPSYSIPTFCKE